MVRTRSSRSRASHHRPHPVVSEARAVLRRSIAPTRLPTSRELGDRLPLLARVLSEHGTRAGLRNAEVCAVLEQYVARLVELNLRERLVGAIGPAAASTAVA